MKSDVKSISPTPTGRLKSNEAKLRHDRTTLRQGEEIPDER